ncbi:MAG: adenylate/guanylate cyclase domain-containing protein [Roseobacter sp.]
MENREDRKFCGRCGIALPLCCLSCGFANESDDVFCGGCGAKVADAPILSPQRAKRPQSDVFEGDRRQLTVMFCDLVGSTLMSEQRDPEEMTRFLTAYRIACADVVERYGGYVANYMGDGLLVYFGYPQAHEDDPQRAIRAGLSVIDAIKNLNRDFGTATQKLNVRIGVNTGLVVAADIAAGERRDRIAVVGDTTNIAARLQSMAEPGTIVIGSRTHRLIEGLFVCDPLGPKQLKGLSRAMEAFRVREATDARSSFEAKLRLGLTPMAGRQKEMGLLTDRWDQARGGSGQVVLLSGEPGVGKSRVLQNFQSIVADDGGSAISFICSSYGQDTPFHPVVDFIERALQVGANATAEATLDKLDAFLLSLDLHQPEYVSLLASMLNVSTTEHYQVPTPTLEDRKSKTMTALLAVVDAYAKRGPLLVLVEDLQWADPSTLEFLSLLIERASASSVLMALAFRADFAPPWAEQPHCTGIRLSPLNCAESIDIIHSVTGGRSLPDDVLENILAKTDGVPLFIEELTKLVLEMDLLALHEDAYALASPLGSTAIPVSLQDSLRARLDHLGPAKEVAQLASVLGRTFGHAVLRAVTQKDDAALDLALERLVDAELLYQRGAAPDAVYEFKHALVKDAAYQGLLHSKRRQLHLETADILESHFSKMTERSPELLSYHYKAAGQIEQAIPYSFKAGDAAAARYAAPEAATHYTSALEMAQSVSSPELSARLQIRAILKLANVASGREQIERNLGNLGTARTLAEKINHPVRLCQIQYWTARTYYVMGRFGLAADMARQALELADTLGDGDQMKTGPVNLLARIHCLQGEPVAAISYANQSVRQMHDAGDYVEEASVSGVLAFALALHGDYDEAIQAADHGVARAEGIDHLPTQAACLMFRGLVNGWFGRLSDAMPDFERSLKKCEQSGDVFRKYLILGWRGEACLIAGEIAAARDSLEQCLELGATLGTSFHRGAFEAFLAKALLSQGHLDAALGLSETAVVTATDSGETWPRSIALRVATETELARTTPDITVAQNSIKAAIAVQSARQCKCDLAWSLLVQGEVLSSCCNYAEAVEAFGSAEKLFWTLGIDRGVNLSKAGLAAAKAENTGTH